MNLRKTVIGLMSGTSLDGVDLAEVEFEIKRKKLCYRIKKCKTYLYPDKLIKQLKQSRDLYGFELTQLDRALGKFYGNLILKFCGNKKPDFISSHGHTVFHQPEKGITLQIGSGAEIAAITGVKTICDFRTTDIALGGQGAPLVPLGDELLFPEYNYCLNLGGYANISYQTKNKSKRLAFDVSVCNVILNYLANEKNQKFDHRGKMASKGKLNKKLFNALNHVKFYHQKEAKSLGNEWFENEILPLFIKHKDSTENKLHTATEHIAFQISKIIEEKSTTLITGGGAYNDYLISRIRALSGSTIFIPDQKTIEFKEAMIFALLGYMREKEWINTFSSVTGAKRNSSGGAIYYP